MFCKWCGNTIKLTDTSCPSCGRETPAMSDCGGFYDLKAPNIIRETGYREASNDCVVKDSLYIEKMEARYGKDRKADKAHHKLTVIFLGVVLVLLVLSVVISIFLFLRIGEICEDLETLQINIESLKSEDMNKQLPLELEPEMESASESEETENEELSENTSAVETIKETNEAGETVFKVRYNNAVELFGNENIIYRWQYATEPDNWQNVNEDVYHLNEEGMSEIVCTNEFLTQIDALQKNIEFRCIIRNENETGDTMEICIRGMALDAEQTDDEIM